MKFSIILPTYNRSKFIKKAIESVIQQTHQKWELIIIDDGSTDNTKEVVSNYVREDVRIQYLYQKNSERSAARNNGIKSVTGQWICFLDSDDFYYPTHLEEFVKLIIKNNYKEGLYFSGKSLNIYSDIKEKYELSHKNNIEFVLLNTFATPQACSKAEILEKYLFNEKIRIGEDTEIWVRILKKYPLFFHDNKTLVQIEHPNRSINLRTEKESLLTLKYILKNTKVNRSFRKKVLSNAFFKISKMYIRENQNFAASIFLIKSLLYDLKNKQTKHRFLVLISFFNFIKSTYKEYQKN